MIQKFLTMLVILMMLIPSVVAAPVENTNTKGLKITDLSKGTMKEIKDAKVNGIKSSSSDIVVDEKGKNHIKLKDTKPSKVKNEHKKVKVSIPKSELQKIDVDNDGKFGVLETADGIVINQYTATSAQLTAGVDFTFSEVEINGFTGYRQETFSSVDSGDSLNIIDASGDYVMTASIVGNIPEYTPIVDNNISTYPQWENIISAMDMGSNIDIATGKSVGNSGVSMSNGIATFNKTELDTLNVGDITYTNNISVFAKLMSSNAFSIAGVMGDYNPGISGISLGIRENRFIQFVTDNSKYTYSGVSSFQNNTMTSVAYVVSNYNATHIKMNSYVQSKPSPSGDVFRLTQLTNGVRDLWIGHGRYYSYGSFQMDEYQIYNTSVTKRTIDTLYAGGDGITLNTNDTNFVGYNVTSGTEKIISNGGPITSIGFTNSVTPSEAFSVTIKYYYTADTTISNESSDGDYHNVSIVYTPSTSTTNGTIARMIPPLYTGTAVLDSNNTNAVMVQNRTHYTIYTGTLTGRSWAGYNVSVPNNADHGMWLNRLMQWVSGVGWNFVDTAPSDYTDDLSEEITVTVS